MAQPPPPGAWHPPPDPSNGDHKGNGWPIAACSIPMLAGAVMATSVGSIGDTSATSGYRPGDFPPAD